MKKPDEVSEVTCEHRWDESEKDNVTPSKAPLTGGGIGRAFESITINRFGFSGEQNFYSIVIVVPLHVSKVSRSLKKLTTYFPMPPYRH
jgi:hypothetical protein